MNNKVIVGGTRTAALNRLRKIAPDNGVTHEYWYDEVVLDGHRIMSFGGERENICWLQDLGINRIAEIITVEQDGICDEMQRYINYVRSANGT